MAGVADSETIDLVAESADGRATLFIVEVQPWGTELAQADHLMAKVNSYFQFMTGPQLADEFPNLVGKPLAVQLRCATEPTPQVQEVVLAATQALTSHDIEFSVTVEPALAADD